MGASLPQLERPSLMEMLNDLESLGLVSDREGFWSCTWVGDGVANWSQQLAWGSALRWEEPLPEPNEDENGYMLGPPCQNYRPALFSPGYCWCCRPLADHLSEVVKAAQRIAFGL